MKKYLYLVLPAVAAMFTSCSQDNDVKPVQDNVITFDAIFPTSSRTSDVAFVGGDRVGLYLTEAGVALQSGGNAVNNELFSYDGTKWTSERKVYWDNGSYDVFAYYPYVPVVDDTDDYIFTVATDQTGEDYFTSDFLYASVKGISASATPIPLQFYHLMSKAVVKLEKSDDYEGDIPADCQVFIHNTVTDASVSLNNGGVYKSGDGAAHTIKTRKLSNNEFCAIVVPQNIESRRPLVEVVTRGVSYLMEGKMSFRQGTQHTLVVTLSKNPEQTKIEIGGSIIGWD